MRSPRPLLFLVGLALVLSPLLGSPARADDFRGGEPGKPIVWRGAGDGEVIIDGQHNERCFDASGIHDVWFENLTIQNAKYGIVSHESSRIVDTVTPSTPAIKA